MKIFIIAALSVYNLIAKSVLLHHLVFVFVYTCTTVENQIINKINERGDVKISKASELLTSMSCFFHSFPLHAVFICSASPRGVAWVPRRTGERGRMHPHLSKRRELSTVRTAMALVSNPWSSTWPISTSWRANNPGNSHLLCLLFSLRAAHRPTSLFLEDM